jgi:hypothetical protein
MSFDNRLLRVSIEIGDTTKIYENLAMTVSGVKFTNANSGNCLVQITNLDPIDRNLIADASSQFIDNKLLKRIKVEAGRVSTGLSTVFEGVVWKVNSTPGPDITTTLVCNQALTSNVETISESYTEPQQIQTIAQDVADSLGKILVFEATPKIIPTYTYDGTKYDQIKKLISLGNYSVFIDAGELVFIDRETARSRGLFKINYNNLVGKPQLTESGVDVQFMFNGGVSMGSLVDIDSRTIPQAIGFFKIVMLTYTLANRETPWYLDAITIRTPSDG